MNEMHDFLMTGNIFLLLFWATWWFKLSLLLLLTAGAVIFHWVKIKKLKHEKADVERQLLERNELLLYSKKNEQKALDKVVLADKNKMMLLSKINHEIRTPMNGVLGMATLLDQTKLTEEQKEYTDIILSSGHSLMGVVNEIMINDILEYSKIDSGKELEAKEFNLASCIEEVFDVFAAKAASSNVDLLYFTENNVPELIIGDVRRVRQVLTNLLENALKFTVNGQIIVEVKLMECKEDNNIKLHFAISDSGSGISTEKLKELNNIFLKPGTSGHSASKGAGLIICHKLISLMGGTIKASSEENKGTTFEFSIRTKAGMQPQQKIDNTNTSCLEDKKILIAESNMYVADIIKKHLEQQKMEVSVVNSSAETLEILTQAAFDMVIADAGLDNTGCVTLAKSIKEKYTTMPVALLKQANDERYKEHETLFNAVINKPLKRQALIDAFVTPFRLQGQANKQSAVHKLNTDFSVKYPVSILIAEDNLVNQRWVTKILGKLGYSPDVVNNGKEVLEVVSTKQYDLILMDVQMPEMDGMEATRMIRLCLETQPVVIAMTANVMQGDKQDCIQSGMNDYISKPVELNDLVEMLEKWAILIKEKRQHVLSKN